MKLASITSALLALFTGIAMAAPVVQTVDFIPDGSRTGFNGFEGIANDGTHFTGGAGPYSEGGITVRQVNGDSGNAIWVTYNFGGQHQGNFSWYPDGGDSGYTELTLTGGGDFADVGMLLGSGFGTPSSYLYQLLEGGVVVLSGTLAGVHSQYLGFSGGGFDTIRLADCLGCDPLTTTVTDGHFQALSIDNIEISGSAASGVPEPGSLALVGVSLLALGLRRKQRG